MLNFLGGLLDNPGRAVGIDPEQIDPNQRGAYRGMVLSALGNQIAGGTPFYQSLASIREGMDAREKADLEMQQKRAMLEAQQGVNAELAGAMDGSQGAQAALGAPVDQAGRVGPTPQRAGMIGQPQGNVNQIKAQALRRAAMKIVAFNPEAAKKYIDMAEAIDPRPEYFDLKEGTDAQGNPIFVQGSKTGGLQTLTGATPKPNLPSSVQEFQYGQQNPDFNQWLIDNNNAKGTKVINQLPGQTPFIETLAKEEAKNLPQLETSARMAAKTNESLNQIIAAAQGGTFSGPLAQGAVGASQFLGSLGVTVAPEMLDRTRLTEVAINNVLANMMSALGARGLTDKDMEILKSTMPTIADNPRSRIIIAQILQQANQRTIQEYNLRRQRALNMPGAQYFVGPEVAGPSLVPGNRPPLGDIFGTQKR